MRIEIKIYKDNGYSGSWRNYSGSAYACKHGVNRYFDIPYKIDRAYLVLTDETDEESLTMRVVERPIVFPAWWSTKQIIQFKHGSVWRRQHVLLSGIENLLKTKITRHFGLDTPVYVSIEYDN